MVFLYMLKWLAEGCFSKTDLPNFKGKMGTWNGRDQVLTYKHQNGGGEELSKYGTKKSTNLMFQFADILWFYLE